MKSYHCVAFLLFIGTQGFLNTAACQTARPGDPDRSEPSQRVIPTVTAEHAEQMARGTALFRDEVRQILTEHCLDCHGGKSVKADFDLSSRDALLQSGYVDITADDSHLLNLITHTTEPHMPFQGEKLGDSAIDAVRRWIRLGAPYDRPLVADRRSESEAQMQVSDHDRQFWSFQKLDAVPIPEVDHVEWCRTAIDRFVLAKQEESGLLPNAAADRRTLLRRATFDLLGLPASMDEVETFLADDTANAWERQVDRLLDSPHFGERWARHWMDVARFAESHGYEQDYDRPAAYHYRDFLIQAFNADMPFDQMVQWQLAGDELAPDEPRAMMATGFLGAGPFPTQLTEAEFESARYDELDDMVTTTGVAFLGLSVGCARCHDHKFDPIPSVDYYRMAATFTTTIRSETQLDLEPEANRRRQELWDARLRELRRELQHFEETEVAAQFAEWMVETPAETPLADWEILHVRHIAAENGSTFTPLPDGSWLAAGTAPGQDTLTVTATSRTPHAWSLRLEALTHDSLPQRGPGRASNGNFALGDVQIEAVPDHDLAVGSPGSSPGPGPGPGPAAKRIRLTSALATHQQNTDSLSVAASIDDDPVTGWAVDAGGIGQDQAAVWTFAEPVATTSATSWRITLRLQHPNPQHGLGRFRLSVGSRPSLTPGVQNSAMDPAVAAALREARETMDVSSPAWHLAQQWFAGTLPEWQAIHQAIEQHQAQGPQLQLATVMVSSEGLPKMKHNADGRGFPHFYPETHILTRGDVHQKQAIATPGFLQVLMPAAAAPSEWQVTPPSDNSRTSFRRAALATWMTDVRQGAGSLLARVIVNRVWQHHFGRGLVATPNDFGVSGERPSHPELLDWLANDLIAHGWQLKRLHRLILISSVYRQSAQYDPQRAAGDRDNRLLWRWTPRRLEAEAIRDSLLTVSGRLDRSMYGPGSLDQNMTRRSIYFFIKRSQLIPMMMLFDWPEHLVSTGQRSTTTIAPQALLFMNSPQGREYASALADQLPQESPGQSVTELWRRAFARLPQDHEVQMASAFLKQQTAIHVQAGSPDPDAAALVDLCQTALSMNEFVYVE